MRLMFPVVNVAEGEMTVAEIRVEAAGKTEPTYIALTMTNARLAFYKEVVPAACTARWLLTHQEFRLEAIRSLVH